MEWISVKEKLPGYDEKKCEYDYVFILNSEGYVSIGQYRNNKWEVLNGENIGAYSCVGFMNFLPEQTTHWMPFPNQPERLSEKTLKGDAIV